MRYTCQRERHKAEHTAYTDEIVQSPQPRHDNQRQDAILSIEDTDNVSIDRAVGRTKNSMNEWHHPPQTKPNRMRHQHIHGSLDLQMAMNQKNSHIELKQTIETTCVPIVTMRTWTQTKIVVNNAA